MTGNCLNTTDGDIKSVFQKIVWKKIFLYIIDVRRLSGLWIYEGVSHLILAAINWSEKKEFFCYS